MILKICTVKPEGIKKEHGSIPRLKVLETADAVVLHSDFSSPDSISIF